MPQVRKLLEERHMLGWRSRAISELKCLQGRVLMWQGNGDMKQLHILAFESGILTRTSG